MTKQVFPMRVLRYMWAFAFWVLTSLALTHWYRLLRCDVYSEASCGEASSSAFSAASSTAFSSSTSAASISTTNAASRVPQRRKLILLATAFHGSLDYGFGLGSQPFVDAGCPTSHCETTIDKDRLDEADAVVIHMRELQQRAPLNLLRELRAEMPQQRWIFFLNESPVHTYLDLRMFDGLFNWTMTYRKDSDFPFLYGFSRRKRQSKGRRKRKRKRMRGGEEEKGGWYQNRKRGALSLKEHWAGRKNRLVAWIVSHCDTDSQREKYVRRLRKYIHVDIYGGCGPLHCPNAAYADCNRMISDRYKFYLAFENSVCRDYVTEKFWNTLARTTAIPVVLGGADYAADAPPNSFVDAAKFSSPRRLAEYLQLLDRNDHLYDAFHAWREDYEVNADGTVGPAFCGLCAALNDPSAPRKSYDDLSRFWSRSRDCEGEEDKMERTDEWSEWLDSVV